MFGCGEFGTKDIPNDQSSKRDPGRTSRPQPGAPPRTDPVAAHFMHRVAAQRIACVAGAGSALWWALGDAQRQEEAARRREEVEAASCRALRLMAPAEAQRTAVARVPGFLTHAECDELRRVVAGMARTCATIERSSAGRHVFMGPWMTTYLHTNGEFQKRLAPFRAKLLEAVKGVDARERWRLLDDDDAHFRTVEYHQYQAGGRLADDRHYDAARPSASERREAAPFDASSSETNERGASRNRAPPRPPRPSSPREPRAVFRAA